MKIVKVFTEVLQMGTLDPKRFVYATLENGKTFALDKAKVLSEIGGKYITDKKLKKLIGQLYEKFEWNRKDGDYTFGRY